MASFSALLCTCMMVIFVTTNVPVEAVKDFKVGGGFGWQQPDADDIAMYNMWAAAYRFHMGDSLSFEYKNDSVLVVDKWDYYHCNTSKPITAFNNGMSVIKLDRSGPFYFISGNIDHCKNGQRLLVEVMSVHPVSASPPSIAFAPMSDMGMAPAPSPSSGVQVSVTLSSVFLALIATSFGFLWFET
ncbi:early nodulin-like protein 1 [Fagus crenata]